MMVWSTGRQRLDAIDLEHPRVWIKLKGPALQGVAIVIEEYGHRQCVESYGSSAGSVCHLHSVHLLHLLQQDALFIDHRFPFLVLLFFRNKAGHLEVHEAVGIEAHGQVGNVGGDDDRVESPPAGDAGSVAARTFSTQQTSSETRKMAGANSISPCRMGTLL